MENVLLVIMGFVVGCGWMHIFAIRAARCKVCGCRKSAHSPLSLSCPNRTYSYFEPND